MIVVFKIFVDDIAELLDACQDEMVEALRLYRLYEGLHESVQFRRVRRQPLYLAAGPLDILVEASLGKRVVVVYEVFHALQPSVASAGGLVPQMRLEPVHHVSLVGLIDGDWFRHREAGGLEEELDHVQSAVPEAELRNLAVGDVSAMLHPVLSIQVQARLGEQTELVERKAILLRGHGHIAGRLAIGQPHHALAVVTHGLLVDRGGVNYCLKFSLFRENLPKWCEPKSNGNGVFSDYDFEAIIS